MQPAQMPEEFFRPKQPTVSELAIGTKVMVEFTDLLIRQADRATYLRPDAKTYPDGLVPLRLSIERTPAGFVLFMPEPCQPKLPFVLLEKIPADAIPVIEIRKTSQA